MKLWDLTTGQCVKTVKLAGVRSEDGIQCLIALSENIVVGGNNEGHIKVWDLTKPAGFECIQTLKGQQDNITEIILTSDNRLISGSLLGYMKVWRDRNQPRLDKTQNEDDKQKQNCLIM